MRRMFLSLSLWMLLPGVAAAQAAAPLTLAQAMADPDWIGNPVEDAWWRWDGRAAHYTQKRDGSNVRDTWQVAVDGGAPLRLQDAARADLDAPDAVFARDGGRSAFARNGDIFVRDLRSGALTQLTRTQAQEAQPQWSDDGALVWRSGNDWYRWSGGATVQVAAPRAEADPGEAPKPDDLRDRQLRLIETLRRDRERRDAAREQDAAWRRADPTRAPAPAYLGKDVAIVDSAASPDGRWLLVVTEPKDADKGQAGKMPRYVTESGYEEFAEVRTRVGHAAPAAQTLWLVDNAAGRVREVQYDALPGIGIDPLAALRKAAGKAPLEGARGLCVSTDCDGGGPAMAWRGDSRKAAVMLRAIDNKDRWIASIDPATAALTPLHHLHDEAWIGWSFNEFGWMPDGGALWYLSEEDGWSHLYLRDAGGAVRRLTDGKWEASDVRVARDGRSLFFQCNRKWPGAYEVCNVPSAGGGVREVTALGGVGGYSLSPDGRQLLVRHSGAYLPPQLALVDAGGGAARALTDTRTPAFKAMPWIAPRYVQVPSNHGAGSIWGKLYAPARLEPGRKYPVVLFVHGAGYLQNVAEKYPAYFREQMFHNLLVQRGYLVLDLDYRASEGYGRDWRTAIYRGMGQPELEDYLDGIDWLVAKHQADRDRVGIYGGSYGGFLTFMALFKRPGTFKAGAALRPVSDWSQYNHQYTANILNTPELDPQAYRRSSPIEFAAGLQDHLLIAHGMIDDNVFYRDSVMLAQKLIELRKDKWELASYPLEAHGFTHPDSWYDEYRRILELFERVLRGQPQP